MMSSKWKPYTEYKQSGLEWFPKIPTHWDVKRVDWFMRDDKIQVTPSELGESVFHYSIPSLAETGDGGIENSVEIGSTKFLIEEDTLLVSKLNPRKGMVLIATHRDLPTICSTEFVPLKPIECDLSWAYFVLSSELTRNRLSSVVQSATRSHQRARPKHVTSMWHFVPPFQEQKQIGAKLLQIEHAISASVTNLESQLILLEEKRSSIITQAVTKGLNLNVEMKNSGIDWLGQIPQHWKTAFLDKIIDSKRRITYGIVQPGEPDPNGIFMVRGQNYSFGWSNPSEVFRVSPEIEAPYSRSRLKPGDILLTIVGAGTGNIAIVPDWLDGANITQTTARIVIDKKYGFNRFFAYLLQSDIGVTSVEKSVKGAAQPGLNLGHLAKFRILIPPINEQKEIVNHLDNSTKSIDEVIVLISQKIAKLKEYRTALISAAVTGKIDLRGL